MLVTNLLRTNVFVPALKSARACLGGSAAAHHHLGKWRE
jgi:hypothetical protein